MITLQNLTYIHPNRDLLFDNIHFTINSRQKIALIGNNGVGKSTLLRIIAGEISPAGGSVSINKNDVYFIPQVYGQFNHLTVAEALKVEDKLYAFEEILKGNASDENLECLNDDWTIEDRCNEALRYWNLSDIAFNQNLGNLSGGQRTKVFLAALMIHRPSLILLDEPSNHLDTESREKLYKYIKSVNATLLVVSHDRTLLNLLDMVLELTPKGINTYGGNYDFYLSQKEKELEALDHQIKSKEKTIKQAKEKERESVERKNKMDVRGQQKQKDAGVARIMMNTLRNKAESSGAKLKGVHEEKINTLSTELSRLRSGVQEFDQMRFNFQDSGLFKGKILVTGRNISYKIGEQDLFREPVSFDILAGDRIALKGANGSGKTTLLKMVVNAIQPNGGNIDSKIQDYAYLDQDYSIIENQLSVLDQAEKFNINGLQDHEIKTRLNHFLFDKNDWDKKCVSLSGGERMRLSLCCLNIRSKSPDIIILDEPTNNLDLQNINLLTAVLKAYQGTLIVVSHDTVFMQEIGVIKEIQL
ncbi:ABC transporter related protein [Pseudopedobacter saltans DSM 12145]|uniref:ABC transporter related protein n=1 Tax=Pseudopedobacter saltans (strain ATCC 51119 / DSM 12145 / JCM 21818 / CCUG 39354 / LMG 10337 / NBRC 100064 / NCIMB 13643) TaxID=762903 RepID=F0SAA6_PSESL|nr:ABC-F family ATP-binding cassette domain-containing protein [Pseudopedobacter saltans]ADY51483.1 ABC transporter related protein [Pseudopedobacter saltans DSM 12145]